VVSLATSAFAMSNDFLVPFWGSELSPADTTSWRISLQLDQFTELDKDSLRFPLDRKTDDCEQYCQTIGFNTLQATHTFQWRGADRLSAGSFFGIADDAFTGFLQNGYSHRRNNVASVPRQGEREGILFGASLEANWDFTPGWIFGGMGLLVNNVYHEAYFHSGLIGRKQPLFGTLFGIKYSATTRLGAILPSREFLFAGRRYFPSLFPIVGMGQAEGGLYGSLFGISLELSWRGGYSTGVFLNQDTGAPEGMWLEGLKTVIWKFSFERYNDALNGTDYGPTYGVKLSFLERVN
jgi:hypothetical protein